MGKEGRQPEGPASVDELEFEQFREAVEQTAHAVYITDTDGVIEYANPAFEAITGYSEAEAIGNSTSLLQSGEHTDEMYEDLWETILDGEQWENEMIDQRKDGERIVLEQTISPLSDEDGEIRKFIAVAQDVTTRREYEQRIREQRDDLELLNQVLRHDIRNHLQVASAYTAMLEDHVDEEGRDKLEVATESVSNAIELTRAAGEMAEVMRHSSTDNRSMPLYPQLTQEIEQVRTANPEAVIRVEGSVPTVEVVGNSMLDSVFRNLLKNAIQHNDAQPTEVTVAATELSDRVTVTIADNGPGIPDAQKAEIFGKGTKGLDSAGTGIGLYLVRSLVEGAGGQVRVEDNEPRGARFVVELPKSDAE